MCSYLTTQIFFDFFEDEKNTARSIRRLRSPVYHRKIQQTLHADEKDTFSIIISFRPDARFPGTHLPDLNLNCAGRLEIVQFIAGYDTGHNALRNLPYTR